MINIATWQDTSEELNERTHRPDLFYLDPPAIRSYTYNYDALSKSNLVGINYKPLHHIDSIDNVDIILIEQSYLNRLPYPKLQEVFSNSRIKKYMYLLECSMVSPENYELFRHDMFDKIFTWDTQLLDLGDKYILNYFPSILDEVTDITMSVGNRETLCSIIVGGKQMDYPGELYSKRREAIKWFEYNHPEDLLFYGIGYWMDFSYIYKGYADNKKDIYNKSYFSICYENNCIFENYITEKIFDCFLYGCVPIYWGATNVSDLIPDNCYIDMRNYNSYDSLYEDLVKIKNSNYNDYLENINNYMHSNKSEKFTYDHFYATINNQAIEDCRVK